MMHMHVGLPLVNLLIYLKKQRAHPKGGTAEHRQRTTGLSVRMVRGDSS
jgi:hypothetical protein